MRTVRRRALTTCARRGPKHAASDGDEPRSGGERRDEAVDDTPHPRGAEPRGRSPSRRMRSIGEQTLCLGRYPG
ncbi:cobalamin biosynthesis protein CbiG [Burkholderia oklahomensis C6786]|nr:cobalamin biosynthesis protein CbiG [Burkholderia oklahomensis C6786]KUY54744.1 cobalamin biosynthesis protein CbiG [Burkholderia oklahomensis C6786]